MFKPLCAAAWCLVAATASTAIAAEWPDRPIRLIVPQPAGQTVDTIGRLLAESVRKSLGQPMVVENHPGAGAMLGTAYAAKAKPDGYTWLVAGAGGMSISPHIYKTEYDPLKDFSIVVRVATLPLVVAVNPSVPVKDFQELVAYSKQNPKAVTYSSSGVGSVQHLTMAMLVSSTGAKMMHVPYKGSGGSAIDVMSGEITATADTIPVLAPLAKSGKVRLLGITSIKRSPFMPNVPTLDEQGIKGFDVGSWTGLFAPAGTPPAIMDRMNRDMREALKDPVVKKRFNDLGMELIDESREASVQFLQKDYQIWKQAVQTSGAKSQ